MKDVLRQAFVSAEKDYLNSIDEYLAEKTELQCQIPENISQYDVIVSGLRFNCEHDFIREFQLFRTRPVTMKF